MNTIALLSLFVLCFFYFMPNNCLAHEPFLWGAATAAYQIEGAAASGGRTSSIWDTFSEMPNKTANGDTGAIAADAYHHVESDVAMMRNMSLNSYRFSISWSRIIPQGRGQVNAEGIAYYNRLIDLLIASNITPMITLYHWDLPMALEREYGGWRSPMIEEDFRSYADVCFSNFGDRVKMWATINEPWTFAYLGYGTGDFAPGRCSDRKKCAEGDTPTETYIVAHNMLNAHASVVDLYRRQYKKHQLGRIGIVLNLDWAEPFDAADQADVSAAQRMNEFTFNWFADPIFYGSYPLSMQIYVGDRLPRFSSSQRDLLIGSYDFLGINHYTMKFVRATEEPIRDYSVANAFNAASESYVDGGWIQDQKSFISTVDTHGQKPGPQAASSWLVVAPEAFLRVLTYVAHRYGNPTIYVTENGCDVPGESQMSVTEALKDDFRIRYYEQYLTQLEVAVARGIDIRGYFAWSLMDNFEWKDGYNYRFGLNYVDYKSVHRTRLPKDSAKWFARYIDAHRDPQRSGNSSAAWLDFLNAASLDAPWWWLV